MNAIRLPTTDPQPPSVWADIDTQFREQVRQGAVQAPEINPGIPVGTPGPGLGVLQPRPAVSVSNLEVLADFLRGG